MKKTKIKQRLENAVGAFFDDENLNKNNAVSFANDSDVLRNEWSGDFSKKADAFVKILKQVFLFFPGTFLLFILSLGTALAVSNPFGGMSLRVDLAPVILFFAAGIFMTWFGIGDLRKPKHLVIPLSIIATGAILGLVSAILMMSSGTFRKIIFTDAYPLYLFPLALIVPFLAKGWVDRKNENSNL